ncbi:DUF4062 domain-containing protein [Svornostia abyssi]|uniref:DUF4062 domain-containing protein n=1 Tax=Svornostia abyssi TaxID=2898438 RepID=A0ABY5PEE6_9ACTN|nr:DUF4062 domain-containing protein [Parviterribacteraceae bacterium J379]
MEQIFISSLARGDMAAVREAARRAVDALDMRPVMFETGAPSEDDSRRALLDRVANCDALLLLIGAEYGEPGDRGLSPTEEEFQHAVEHGIPVLAIVQDIARESAQEAFLARVRGAWEAGRLTGTFADAGDVAFAVTQALNDWRRRGAGGSTDVAAAARAAELARAAHRHGTFSGGSKLRVVIVPAGERPLLDALTLRDASLPDDLTMAARTAGLVPQSAGVDATVGRDRITLALRGGRGFEDLELSVGFDGSVVGEGAVGDDASMLGSAAVLANRARDVITGTCRFAEAVWARIDQRDVTRDVFVTSAVPDAQRKIYALETVGNSMSMPMGMPPVLVAPDPPLRVARTDLSSAVEQLEAELHRAFEIEGAIHPRP